MQTAGAYERVNWDLYRFFCAVSDKGSLSSAGAELGISAATVARKIGELESELDMRLFDRSHDGYALTAEGRRLEPLAEQMAMAAHAVERGRLALGAGPTEPVRIAAGYWSSRLIVSDLSAFRAEHPEIAIELATSHDFANMSKHAADIALRNIRPDSQRLVVRKLGTIEFAIYGSADYVASHIEARDERRFESCEWVGLSQSLTHLPSVAWLIEHLKIPLALQCSHSVSVYDALRAGAGLGLLPCFVGDAGDNLERVSAPLELSGGHLWLVYHEDVRDVPWVRAVADWLAGLFSSVDA